MDTIKKRILLTPLNVIYKISPELELKLLFRLKQGYKLNLDNPKTFNEKLQWIKLYDKHPLMPMCVDKYSVRKYVKAKKCGEILNELLWEGFNPEEIPFDDLPNKFVIKVTHGSTFNIICKDKSKLDKKKTIKKCKKWLKEKFLPCYGEWFYGIEKPRIIVEKYIESEQGLKDYKVFCFNGEPRYIGVYSDRQDGKTKQELYDLEWKEVKEKTGNFNEQSIKTKKPQKLNELIVYASKLSEDFNHARIDFFIENEQIYFGEITFTSGSGFDKFSSLSFDKKIGDMLKIDTKKKSKVLMIGPSRKTKGGMTTVINNYYRYGLSDKVKLKYIETINDKNIFCKFIKEKIGLIKFISNIDKYEILHAHLASRRSTLRKSIYIRIAKKKNKYIIAHIHGGGFKKFLDEECSKKRRDYVINSLNMCDKIIVLSKEWYNYFSGFIDEEKLIILENSVYVPSENYSTQDNYNILFLGRLEKDKGIYDLLESFSSVVSKYQNAKLYIAGSGENDLVENKIKKLGISQHVMMLGWVSNDEITKIQKCCSLFVLPSYFEAMPMSLLESMAYGCIPVVSNVGGIPGIVENEINGFLVNPGDVVELGNKMLNIFDKTIKERKIISNNAYNTILNKYNIKNSLNKLMEVYNEESKRKNN